MAKWQRGQSGNPAGRLPGSPATVTRLRAELVNVIPLILARLVHDALHGDVAAARLLLERTIPPLKAVEALAAPLPMPEGAALSDHGRAVLAAVSRGELAPAQATALLGSLTAMSKLLEVDELARRVQQLEDERKPK